VLFFAAGALANFLKIPHVAWAYQVMALIPVLNALQHFDIHRLNRHMRFWPVVLTGAVPALISLIAIWPLSLWFGDYRVMLWAIMAQITLMMVVSHLVAERPYRLVFDRVIMGNSLRFGWPLLINGILMFGVFQGDKMIIGRELGMATLAIFAMGFTLTLTPTLVMAKSAQNFFLPQLSKVDRSTPEGHARFQHLSMALMQVSLINGALLVLAVYLLGAPLVEVVLGPKYLPLIPLLTLLAVMQAVRVAKTGASVVALSCGHTSNAMLANLVRVVSLPLAWYAVLQGYELRAVILIATAAEILSYALSLLLVRRRPGVSLRAMFWPIVFSGIFLGFAGFDPLPADLPSWAQATALLLLFLASMAAMREMQRYVTRRRNKT
ncbi:MAG: oligosaccharide flippase family protein, partial [Paracoccaceae bacterium]